MYALFTYFLITGNNVIDSIYDKYSTYFISFKDVTPLDQEKQNYIYQLKGTNNCYLNVNTKCDIYLISKEQNDM